MDPLIRLACNAGLQLGVISFGSGFLLHLPSRFFGRALIGYIQSIDWIRYVISNLNESLQWHKVLREASLLNSFDQSFTSGGCGVVYLLNRIKLYIMGWFLY